jgi:hypothetical protein
MFDPTNKLARFQPADMASRKPAIRQTPDTVFPKLLLFAADEGTGARVHVYRNPAR